MTTQTNEPAVTTTLSVFPTNRHWTGDALGKELVRLANGQISHRVVNEHGRDDFPEIEFTGSKEDVHRLHLVYTDNDEKLATELDTQVVTLSVILTSNTRAHKVVPIGRQHADDQGPMGQCIVCGAVGEWNALIELLPNSYGCAGFASNEG